VKPKQVFTEKEVDPKKYKWDPDSGALVRKDKERKTLNINTELQPWQKAEAKKRERAASHAGPDDRRKARELRRELEDAAPDPNCGGCRDIGVCDGRCSPKNMREYSEHFHGEHP
jgi:radical SAM protein with 4Fe4S-binding SPASM domain